MSKIATLKKKAADLEKKSPEKAISVYVELVAEMERYPEDLDIALYNRVGDLMVKHGNVSHAVDYYEKAVDHYVDGGFLNNAIALCNKILRSSPGRATVYYKLGKISAHKGFKADAKQNFLEYADRMQKSGQMDEAFRALAEFADLCPDQTDIRLMLAEQLAKAGKKDEAVEQLQILHEQLDAEGHVNEAVAAAERMRAIDPTVEPRTGGTARSTGSSDDLVFLDLGDSPKAQAARRSIAKQRITKGMKTIDSNTGSHKAVTPTPVPAAKPVAAPPKAAPKPPARAPEPPPPEPEIEVVEALETVDEAVPERIEITPEPVFEEPPVTSSLDPDASGLLGFESTSLGDHSATSSGFGGGLELEPTSLLDLPEQDIVAPIPFGEAEAPAAEEAAEEEEGAGMLDFIMPDGAEEAPSTRKSNVNMPRIQESVELVAPLELAEPAPEIPMPASDLEDLARVSAAHPSALVSAKSVDVLQAVVDGDPEDWSAHRELAEALLESGSREAGLRELETAMMGFEKSGDLTTAMSVADEIVRIDPSSVKHHQKRVEYAYRTSDRGQLVESYLSLADALFRTGQVDKSRTIYQRVLELSPDDLRAQAALTTMPEPAPEPPPAQQRKTTATKKQAAPVKPVPIANANPTPIADDAFVNLGDWLRDDESPKDTRMVVAEEEPTGNEEADFQDMLRKFKQGVAENVEAEDYQSHYDLGVAYKEMGLIDEAISEFQKALRGPDNRVRTYEAIGQCFIEKEQNQMAATVLARALTEKAMDDDQLVGVLYLLGRAHEALGRGDEALQYYQRVFVVDIQFHDVADRLSALENATR
jgi:tetratricopeptide (TPR) repeat protein